MRAAAASSSDQRTGAEVLRLWSWNFRWACRCSAARRWTWLRLRIRWGGRMAPSGDDSVSQSHSSEGPCVHRPQSFGCRPILERLSLSCSCCFGELGRGLAPDLNDHAALKFLVASLLAPPHERLPLAVDLDAPQQ